MNLDPIGLIISAFVFLLAVGLVLVSIHVVPAHQRLVVFRLGALVGVRGPGLTVLLPVLDRGVTVEMRPQTRTIENLELLLADRSRRRVDVEYVFSVVDAVAWVMNVAQPEQALEQLVATTLQTLAGARTPANLERERATMGTEIIARTREGILNWGIALEQVVVTETAANSN